MSKRILTGSITALCMLILIIDTKTAIAGAEEGISLCIRVLIPSLFPFFILSILLTDQLSGLFSSALRPLGKLLKIPKGAEAFVLIGMLGGYPVGAQTICQARQYHILQPNDANRMLGFCNNVGPAFLFGVISPQFPEPVFTWCLWGILIFSALFTGFLLPDGSSHSISAPKRPSVTVTQAMERSLKIMGSVCGWAVMFRVVLAFLDRWFLWILPKTAGIAVHMILELSNGCIMLDQIDNVALRFVICAAGLSFGGLCVTAQTFSVAGKAGVGMYLPGKLLQTVLVIFLSLLIVTPIIHGFRSEAIAISFLFSVGLIIFLSYFRKHHKNKYGNLHRASV